MTAEEYIKQQYGETWLRTEWSAGDVIDALDGLCKSPHRRGRTPFPGED